MGKLKEKATKAKPVGKLRQKAAARSQSPELVSGQEQPAQPAPGVASETQFNQPPPPPPPLEYFSYYARIPGLRNGNR